MSSVVVSLPVWGSEYIHKWATWSLPTLLAPGNLPAIADEFDVDLQVVTTQDSALTIENMTILGELRKYCTCAIRVIEPPRTPYQGMARANYLVMKDAIENHRIYTCSLADMIWSGTSFSFLVRTLSASPIVMSWAGISDELGICSGLEKFRRGFVVDVSPRDLVALVLMWPHEIQRRWTLSTSQVPRALTSLIVESPAATAAVVKSFTLGVLGVNFQAVSAARAKHYLAALRRGVPGDHSSSMNRLLGDLSDVFFVEDSDSFLITSFDGDRPLNAEREVCPLENVDVLLRKSISRQSKIETDVAVKFFKKSYVLRTNNTSEEWIRESVAKMDSLVPDSNGVSRVKSAIVNRWWSLPASIRETLDTIFRKLGLYRYIFRLIRGFRPDKTV